MKWKPNRNAPLLRNGLARPGKGHYCEGPAFTVIELLVVIGLIGLLAALLLPALNRAKVQALRVQCMSNLHQIGVALRLYLDDFQKYPPFSSEPVPFPRSRTNFWDYKLLAYMGNVSVFLCPAQTGTNNDPIVNWTLVDRSGHIWPNRSYGYNTYGGPQSRAGFVSRGLSPLLGFGDTSQDLVAESKVVAPADMIAVTDYDPFTDDGRGGLHPDYLWDSCFTGKPHSQGADVLFCDTHVEYGKSNVWMAWNDGAIQRWNNDHQMW